MIARRSKELNLKQFYKEFLRHTSNSFPAHRRITDMELEILTEFWILEGDLIRKDRFSTTAKRAVREEFGFKNYSNLENYITKLIEKGYLIKVNKKISIKPAINLAKDKLRDHKKITLVYEFNIV
jgi:hypothetical protein